MQIRKNIKDGDFMTINLFDENAVITEKVRHTADLFAAHIMDAAKDAENWASFLRLAGKMYKYSFVDQVLIHAQRPDATACASFDFWNSRMQRWVKKGSKGVALIDRTNPQNPRLKHVFDIQDTAQSRDNTKTPYIWQMGQEHAPHVRKALSAIYGVDDPDMQAQLTSIVKRLTVVYAGSDESYKNLVANSAVYCIMSRC
jgi:predicted dehydrogenase